MRWEPLSRGGLAGGSRDHADRLPASVSVATQPVSLLSTITNGESSIVESVLAVRSVLVGADPDAQVVVDLPAQQVKLPDGRSFAFAINPHHKHNLVNGLDEIGLTLQKAEAIRAYEAKRRVEAPWLFN